MITCHGELTPMYTYIAQLREQNEVAAKKEAKAKEAKKEVSHNLMNLKMSGHLFDSHYFNKAINILE